MAVHADADQPARKRALEFVAASQIGSMRPAVAHRHAKALGAAQHNVGRPFARRRKQRKRQQVGGHAQRRTIGMGYACQRTQVVNRAAGGRVLRQHTKVAALSHQLRHGLCRTADLDFNAQRLGAGLEHFNRLRMAVASDDKHIAFAFDTALGQRHGLGGGGGFVKHGCVGNRHTRQVANHGLKVDQCFQPALGNFCLVGRVGGVPSRVFQHIAQNYAGRVGAVIALADEAFEHLVFGSHGFELLERGCFGHWRRKRHRAGAGNRGRDNAVNQCAQRR